MTPNFRMVVYILCHSIAVSPDLPIHPDCLHVPTQSLSHCELITDDGIRALSSSTCGQERLTVVELDNCPLITDVTLEHLKSCHRLERIELYDCQQVTRAGIKRIRVSGAWPPEGGEGTTGLLENTKQYRVV